MTQSQAGRIPQSLARITVFAGLAPSALARIESRCRWRRYEPGESIVDHLDTSDDVYFITSGEACASIYSPDGKAVTFSNLSAGDLAGEIAAIDGCPRSMSIEARKRCIVASMPAVAFREVLQFEPAVTLAVLRYLVTKVRELTTRVFEFSALAVGNRVQAEILRLAKAGRREGRSARIEVAPTHAEIASRISSHREAVTRELNRLSRIGMIERRGKALIVTDLERLATMVHEVTGE